MLAASLTQTPELRTINLATTIAANAPMVRLTGVGALYAESLDITICKSLSSRTNTSPSGVSLNTASPYTWEESGTGALTLATKALEEIKIAVGALAGVGEFITNNGLGALLEVRAARFQANLGAARGGNVSLQADLVYMNKPQRVQFAFNFHDPLTSVQNLAKSLLPA